MRRRTITTDSLCCYASTFTTDHPYAHLLRNTGNIGYEKEVKDHMKDDRTTFVENLVRNYHKLLENVCRHAFPHLEHLDLMHEAVEDAFVKSYMEYPEIHDYDERHLKGWLCEVCLNRMKTLHRSYQRLMNHERSLEEYGGNLREDYESSLFDAEQEERNAVKAKVGKMMRRLPSNEREIIYEHYLDKMTVQDIAEENGVSKNDVRTMLRQALSTLREHPFDPEA